MLHTLTDLTCGRKAFNCKNFLKSGNMFKHSLPVPQLYKAAAKVAREAKENSASVKNLIYSNKYKHFNIKALYALVIETLQRSDQLDLLIRQSQILIKETRLDPWLARILITELLWGKKRLQGESKPTQTVLSYQDILKDILQSSNATSPNNPSKVAAWKPRYVRINTLKISINEAVDNFCDEGWTLKRFTPNNYEDFLKKVRTLQEKQFMIDMHIKDLLIFPPSTQFHNHNAYLNGSIILQDKASCLPVCLLNPPVNSVVLDMCAAPGMKTSHIATLLNNKGTIYAVENEKERCQVLRNVVKKAGADCIQVINEDVLQVTAKNCPGVEYILVDPSCTGSGMVNRVEFDSDIMKDNSARLQKLVGFQVLILRHALKAFPNAQRVVYSTCSINPDENEHVVKRIIENCPTFKLMNAKKLLKKPWNNFGSSDYGKIGKYCLYAKPQEDLTNGFFVAVFEKLKDGEINQFYIRNQNSNEVADQSSTQDNVSSEKNLNREDCNESNGENKELKKKCKYDNNDMAAQCVVPKKKKNRKRKLEDLQKI